MVIGFHPSSIQLKLLFHQPFINLLLSFNQRIILSRQQHFFSFGLGPEWKRSLLSWRVGLVGHLLSLFSQLSLLPFFNYWRNEKKSGAEEKRGREATNKHNSWNELAAMDGLPPITFSFINQLLAFHAQPQLNNSRKEDSLPPRFGLVGLVSWFVLLFSIACFSSFHFISWEKRQPIQGRENKLNSCFCLQLH